jgi:hypothetical protein
MTFKSSVLALAFENPNFHSFKTSAIKPRRQCAVAFEINSLGMSYG